MSRMGFQYLPQKQINNCWPQSGQNKNKKIDVKNGIRTHALSDQYLKLAP